MKYYTALLSKDGIKLKPETDLSNLDRVIDRTGGEFSLTFKAPTTNVDCDDQRSEVTPL